MTSSDEGDFWDRRYRSEGAIWGEGPSPTALEAARYLRPGSRVFEIGYGYGRDLVFLGYRGGDVSGIELADAGLELAIARLGRRLYRADQLRVGRFEDADLPGRSYDLVLCHRMAHLLLTPEATARFADKVEEILRPGGLLFLAARDTRDLNPAEMKDVGEGVYEYIRRPGHRIRYWQESTFRTVFGKDFTILGLSPVSELESVSNPVPSYLTMMAARSGSAPALPGPLCEAAPVGACPKEADQL